MISICNAAIALSGGKSIANLNEASVEAQACKVFLDETRRAVLAAHPWNCATEWIVPALIGEKGAGGMPEWPYSYAFTLPEDVLRVLRIETGMPAGSLSSRAKQSEPFMTARHREQRMVLCDVKAPTLVVLRDVAKAALLPAKLKEAIMLALAARLALPLAEGRTRAADFEKLHMVALQEAMLADAREEYSVIPLDDAYITARGGMPPRAVGL